MSPIVSCLFCTDCFVSQQLWLQWQLEKNKSGYKKFSSSEEIVWKKHSICLTFAVTLTLNTALQSFYRILGLIMIRHQLCLAVKGSAVQKTQGKSKFDYIIPHSHFDLWDSKLIFWISIRLMMRSLHTKFSYKTVDSSDIIWTRLRHIERWTEWFKIPNHIQ